MPRHLPRRAVSRLTLGLLLIAGLLAGVAIADDDDAARRVGDGRHAFISRRDGVADLFVRPASGGPAVALTHNAAAESDPAWSPDGKQIAFVSDQAGNLDIWVIDAAGGEARQITRSPGVDQQPSWSPDGRRIVFVSIRDGRSNLFIVDVEGGAESQLTDLPEPVAFPDWSPDGRTIAFTIAREFEFSLASQIAVIPATGGELTLLTNDPGFSHQAAWSPDGSRIAYTAVPDGHMPLERASIAVVPVTGGARTLLTDNPWGDLDPTWSPDGRRIAFVSNRDGLRQIYVMNADGSNPVRVATGAARLRPRPGRATTRLRAGAAWTGAAVCCDHPRTGQAEGAGMDVGQAIRGRRSVGAFGDRSVPRATVAELIEAATWAPTHHLTQPWRFAVLAGDARAALAGGDRRGRPHGRRCQDRAREADACARLRRRRAAHPPGRRPRPGARGLRRLRLRGAEPDARRAGGRPRVEVEHGHPRRVRGRQAAPGPRARRPHRGLRLPGLRARAPGRRDSATAPPVDWRGL